MTNEAVKKLRITTIVAAIFTGAFGVLGHFAYDFLGQQTVVGLFFPVNESTWEHLKLLFFPMLICLLAGYLIIRNHASPSYSNGSGKKDKICSSCYMLGAFLGLVSGMLLIVILFYTFQGIIGYNLDWLNIVIYFIGVIGAYIIFYSYSTLPFSNTFVYHNRKSKNSLITTRSDSHCKNVPAWLSILGIVILAALFFIFTFYTPHIGLFYDPVTQGYGI